MQTTQTQNAAGGRRLAESQTIGVGLHAQGSAVTGTSRSEFASVNENATQRYGGPRPIREILAGLDIVRQLARQMEDPAWPTEYDLARARLGLAGARARGQCELDLRPLQ
jgi:hypothetical protein